MPARILEANSAFMVVVVPAGTHHVELRYVDSWFRAGGWISALAWIATLGLVLSVRARWWLAMWAAKS